MIAATLGLFLWAAAVAPAGPVLILSDLLGWSLLCLAVIDVATFRLPDILNLPLIAAGLAASLFLPGRPVLDHLAGAAGGWALLAGLSRGYRAWRGMDGLGLGDAKLLGAAGAWLGWRPLPSVLLIACLAAFAWVAVRRLRSGEPARTMRIAFGAPLALATWIVWLHGPLPV
jgi:leader peptidase (prepilin peptidase)/N-methyltransferase